MYVTAIGILAAVCTTTAFIPQAVKTIKTRRTEDISLIMYVVLTFGVIAWLVYGIVIKDLPIIAANGVTVIFTSIVLIIKIKSTI